MGAWGYGVFETDNAMDFVGEVTDFVSDSDHIKLANGKTTDSGWWMPYKDGNLHSSVVKKICQKFSAIEREIILKYDFGVEERYLVLCHIIQMHGLDVPPKHLNKSIKIINSMLGEEGDSEDYDNPLKRKNVVNEVLSKLKIQKLESKLQKELSTKTEEPTKKFKM